MEYRYRNDRSTRSNIEVFDRVLNKLGRIKTVRAVVYRNKYRVETETILVRGENGYARFGGLNWGYSGEGPRGTQQLLKKLGVNQEIANFLCFNETTFELGEVWKITFNNNIATVEHHRSTTCKVLHTKLAS